MFNNFFRKKEKLTEIQKNMLRYLSMFYETNKTLFTKDVNNQKEKKEIIKKIYVLLNYSNFPVLSNNQEMFENSNIKVYRGISALNEELLNSYINDFINGETFYGGRASIYGTGIYSVIGADSNIASEYAYDGGKNNCGVVIESVLANDSKIIEYSKIDEIRTLLFEKIRKMYDGEVEYFLNILEDDGALASILGYDAIYVEDKNYMVILNRGKMIVNIDSLNIENTKSKNNQVR